MLTQVRQNATFENSTISEIFSDFVVDKNNETKEFRYDYQRQSYWFFYIEDDFYKVFNAQMTKYPYKVKGKLIIR